MACLHLMRDELDAAIYIDTGYSYPETRAMIDYANTLVPVHRVAVDRARDHLENGIPTDVVPVDWTPFGQAITHTKPITLQASYQCCYSNIAKPFSEAAKRLGATHVVSGQRNDEACRSTAQNGDLVDGLIRLFPIADWTAAQVLAYLATKMDVPPHYAINHSSLDCYDCTAFHQASHDRIAWTKAHHPTFYAAYTAKHRALCAVLREATKSYDLSI